ncbi:hypothetical protein OIU35_31765 [Boseaceae bacterium BT-24-1]|nr:hypothetical protein [Boseaceae bacterium BT-24-1]
MRQSRSAVRQLTDSRQTNVGEREAKAERIIAFLRRMYPSKTADNVAADIGGSSVTLQKMIDRRSTPSVVTYGRMLLAYGPEFLMAVYPNAPKWMSDAYRKEQQEALLAAQKRISEQLAALEPLT